MRQQKKSNQQRKQEEDFADFRARFSASLSNLNYRNPTRLDPYPQRYRTVITTSIQGYIAAGTGALTYYCLMNGAYRPFASGGWSNATPAIATLAPTGFSNLCNAQFYTKYRIMTSRITLQIAPESTTDSIITTITASNSSTAPASTSVANAQSFTRGKIVQHGQPEASQKIVNKTSIHLFYGVRKQAILDDFSGVFLASYNSNPGAPLYWVINITSNDAVSTGNTNYRVVLQQDIEFFGDIAAVAPEAFARTASGNVPTSAASILRTYAAKLESGDPANTH